jgi:hypothetical protein
MKGIGSAASSTDVEVNLTAATLWINAATNVSAEGVTISENYYQAIKVETGAHADFTDVTLANAYPATSVLYATDIAIGIWSEGGTTASSVEFTGTTPDVGVVAYGGSLNASSMSFSGHAVAAVVSAGWAETSLSDVTVSSGSHLGVYSKDSTFFSVSSSSIETSNVYPVVVCQDNSEETTGYEAYFESNSLGAMRFGPVSVDGSGNTFEGTIYVDGTDLNGQFASVATTESDVDCSISLY